jgi:hypothetical protein
METSGSSEALVNIYQTTWRHIPEYSYLHTQCSANLKSHILSFECLSWALSAWGFPYQNTVQQTQLKKLVL